MTSRRGSLAAVLGLLVLAISVQRRGARSTVEPPIYPGCTPGGRWGGSGDAAGRNRGR